MGHSIFFMSLLDTTVAPNGTMGLSHGLQSVAQNHKLKNRWLFSIPSVAADVSANAMPPRKASRPGISMKEFEFQHLSETIWYPLKAEWKVVNITLYDIRCNNNAVFDWLRKLYDTTNNSDFNLVVDSNILQDATLELYNGCGDVIECWQYYSCYPQNIEWGELDMASGEIVVVDMTLRYQRATFSGTCN